MGKTQHHYDYPEVHPPHPQQEYRGQKLQTNLPPNSRYSYTKTPVEAHDARYAQLQNRQPTAPPLPAVPEHLKNDIQRQQHVPRESSSEPRIPLQIQTERFQQQMPTDQASGSMTQHRSHTYIEQPGLPSPSPAQSQQIPQPPTSPPPPADAQPKPDPVKQAPDHPNYRSPIMPDENPLTPTSPGLRKDSRHRQNTNIPVLSPSTSSYNFASYAPVPQPTTSGSWSHGLCSCSEPAICMTGLFCPCVLYGRVQHRLQLRSDKKDATNMLGYSTVNGSCIAWAFLCGINGILSGIQKTRVRRSYEMEAGSGTVCSDCLEGCCCCCCVLSRNEKEIKGREEGAGGGGTTRAGTEGYVPPGGMTFAPPPR